MSDIALLYSTFANRAEAERVAKAVLNERLAACVNILGDCMSVYRWEGKVEQGQETPALFKTVTALAPSLRRRIEELHSYDLPVIEQWPAQTGARAFQWVENETRSNS